MNNNVEINNDFEALWDIRHLFNEQFEDQLALENDILQNPINDQNQVNNQDQEKQISPETLKYLLMSWQMMCVFEHYKWLIVTQFYFIFEFFLNMQCYYSINSLDQNNLQYVFAVWIILDILNIIQNSFHFFLTYDHVEKANDGLPLFKINEQMYQLSKSAKNLALLTIKNSIILQKLIIIIKYLSKSQLVISPIIILTNVQELLNLSNPFIYIIMILKLVRIINDSTVRFNPIQKICKIYRVEPLKQKMTKRRMCYLYRKTFLVFIIPFFYLYEMKSIIEVYHSLPAECSHLDISFQITFALIWCIIIELFINILMAYKKLNEDKDIFEKKLLGISEIIFIVGILFSWYVIYENYNTFCISKQEEYSKIRKCIYDWPLFLILSYTCYHYRLLNKNILSKAQQGKISKKLTEENMCIICLQEFEIGEQFIRLKCHKDHVFHKSCILDWFENNHICPKCKENDI